MSIITDFKQIEPIVPNGFGMGNSSGMFNYVSDSIILTKCMFGMIYDKKEKYFTKIFKVLFGTYKTAIDGYLIVGDCNQPINSKTPALKKPLVELRKCKDNNIWGFEKDDVGLYIKTNWPTEYQIYFGTEFTDIGKLRELKKMQQIEKVVTAETVYA